jgi:hypothetical protein
VWVNALLMMNAHIGWDKYILPLVVVLWFLVADRAPEQLPQQGVLDLK